MHVDHAVEVCVGRFDLQRGEVVVPELREFGECRIDTRRIAELGDRSGIVLDGLGLGELGDQAAGLAGLEFAEVVEQGGDVVATVGLEIRQLGFFERYLSVWVALCIVVGIALGYALPGAFAAIASAEVANVNLVVAVLIWLMIIPMLLKIDFGALGSVRQHWKGVGVTLFINWAVKPFSMAALGTVFLAWLFAPLLPHGEIPSYIAGLILLAAAPCTAMVFVWSNLCDGEPNFTLSQVALNDVLMVFLFAPLVALLLGVASVSVPWNTLLISVVLYIVVPVIVAQVIRRSLIASGGQPALDRLLKTLGPISLIALLATLALLFGFQGQQILAKPLVIALIAVPILIQVYFNAGLA